ncbi:MAG: radical SAM protein [Deltaproteobacteria bacterium]|nr:radical SAM protein [Deltaproteobacteria bacterium]
MEKILYPVGLSYIASAIYRSSHELSILDMDANRIGFVELEEQLRKLNFDAVGFGCIVTGYKIVKEIALIVKKVNPVAWVIVGNSVASSIPQTLLKNTVVDIAVIGEGDITIVEVLDCLDKCGKLQEVEGIYYKDKNEIKKSAARKIIPDIDAIPFPEWDLFDVHRYLEMSCKYVSEPYPMELQKIRAFPVNTARGCAFKCTFCYHVFRNDKYRYRSASNIIQEISELQKRYQVNYVNFWDELTLLSIKQTEILVDTILASGLEFYWTAACRGDLFNMKDIDLLKKMKKTGCIGLGYALESANRNILKSMNKKLDPNDFIEQTKALKKAGIVSWTSLVIGYPEETEDTIRETFELCYQNDIYPSSGFLLPQPGTPMYEYAVKNGFICDEESYLMDMGDRQDLRVNLTKIPNDQLHDYVSAHLRRIRDKLQLNLSDDQLLKSGKYRRNPS